MTLTTVDAIHFTSYNKLWTSKMYASRVRVPTASFTLLSIMSSYMNYFYSLLWSRLYLLISFDSWPKISRECWKQWKLKILQNCPEQANFLILMHSYWYIINFFCCNRKLIFLNTNTCIYYFCSILI